ncbi:MAG: hypothetical protein CVU42_06390 [Chloroflexi bacterium HGW-Chloroflexi-4]|nr:MAG: hypothetical protein CVU42_06390 [Chloroflexi bacterium HGW-Chloroflexi-4]
MKKVIMLSIVFVAAVFTLGSVNKVYASSETPSIAGTTAQYGFGGQGGMMGGSQPGLLHDEMVEVVAEKLGITVEDLTARLDDGENLYSVAIAEGLSNDEAKAMLLDARSEAIDLAVANGDLTQTQADFMKARIKLMGEIGAAGTRGMMGGFRGANGSGSCIGNFNNN